MRKLNLSKSVANKSPQRTKSFLAMLVLAFGLFLGMAEEGKAQPGGSCETGYSMQSATFSIGSCTITFWACVKCDPSGYTDNAIRIKGWEVPTTCPTVPSDQEILDSCNAVAVRKLLEYGGSGWCTSYYPPYCDEIPPPNHYYITEQKFICWQLVWQNGKVYEWNCDGAYCQTTWKVCYNRFTGQLEKTLYYGPAISGTVTCERTDRPTTNPNEQNPYTYCWKFPTSCD